MPAGKRKDLRFYLVLFSLFISFIIADRYSKYYVLKNLLPAESIPIIKNIFHITLVYNTGIAFGMFKGNNFIFIIISILVIPLVFWHLKDRSNKSIKVAIILITAGAVGNLIDRLSLGFVVDFLDFRIWPVFNLSDVSITFGVIVIFYNLLINKK